MSGQNTCVAKENKTQLIGIKKRTRTCIPPENGGANCEGVDEKDGSGDDELQEVVDGGHFEEETENCTVPQCPPTTTPKVVTTQGKF